MEDICELPLSLTFLNMGKRIQRESVQVILTSTLTECSVQSHPAVQHVNWVTHNSLQKICHPPPHTPTCSADMDLGTTEKHKTAIVSSHKGRVFFSALIPRPTLLA